jgi:DNA-binding beta-propeller fold protein YncE
MNDHVYWTDYGTDKIQRADLDGANVVDVITTGLSLPRGVDLDIDRGKLYWADRQTDLLQRSALDGSSIEDLHQAMPSSAAPHGVAVDTIREHVYWVDNGLVTIKRMDVDGANVVELLGPSDGVLDRPWQIELDLRTSLPTCVPGYPCSPDSIDERIDELTAAILDGNNPPAYDYTRDGLVTDLDHQFLVRYVLNSSPGDLDLDGNFGTNDLVVAFQAGFYEDAIPENARWSSGDWNGDFEFDSSDLVAGLASGNYEGRIFAAAVPEPATGTVLLLGVVLVGCRRLRH